MKRLQIWLRMVSAIGLILPQLMSAVAVGGEVDVAKVEELLLLRFDENGNNDLDPTEIELARTQLRDLLQADRTGRIFIAGCRDDIRPLFEVFDTDEDKAILNGDEVAAAKRILNDVLSSSAPSAGKQRDTLEPSDEGNQRQRPRASSTLASFSGGNSWQQPFSLPMLGPHGWGTNGFPGQVPSASNSGLNSCGAYESDFAFDDDSDADDDAAVLADSGLSSYDFDDETDQKSLSKESKNRDSEPKGDDLSETVDDSDEEHVSEDASDDGETEGSNRTEDGEGGARRLRVADPRPAF